MIFTVDDRKYTKERNLNSTLPWDGTVLRSGDLQVLFNIFDPEPSNPSSESTQSEIWIA